LHLEILKLQQNIRDLSEHSKTGFLAVVTPYPRGTVTSIGYGGSHNTGCTG